jgi:hypothetical protein
MNSSLSIQNMQDILTFPFEDPQWPSKLLIASLLMIANFVVPLVPMIFLLGYVTLIMQHILRENGRPYLPEWQDWGELFKLGLRLGGLMAAYFVPLLMFFGIAFAFFLIPPIFLGAAQSNGKWIAPEAEILVLFSTLTGMGLFGIAFLLSMIVGALLPGALCHTAARGEFAAGFRVREWWPVYRANLVGFLLVFFTVSGIFSIASMVLSLLSWTIVLSCLVPFLSSALFGYQALISYPWYAQVYREGQEKLAAQARIPVEAAA